MSIALHSVTYQNVMKQFKQSQLLAASGATGSLQFCLNKYLNKEQRPIEIINFYCGRTSGGIVETHSIRPPAGSMS